MSRQVMLIFQTAPSANTEHQWKGRKDGNVLTAGPNLPKQKSETTTTENNERHTENR